MVCLKHQLIAHLLRKFGTLNFAKIERKQPKFTHANVRIQMQQLKDTLTLQRLVILEELQFQEKITHLQSLLQEGLTIFKYFLSRTFLMENLGRKFTRS